MKVSVLRLGHRLTRDRRASTHLCLTARAFGANEVIFDVRDDSIKKSVDKIVENWGGNFEVKFTENWKKYVEGFDGEKIHLTMYGINVDDNNIREIKSSKKDKLIIVGGKKVPPEIYKMVDYNIAIGNQPHSEIAALAIFLDRLHNGKELKIFFSSKGKKKIIPRERGKKVVVITKED